MSNCFSPPAEPGVYLTEINEEAMKKRTVYYLSLLCAVAVSVISVLGIGTVCRSEAIEKSTYTYRYKDSTVRLTPSDRFVALEENAPSLNLAVQQGGLVRDTLSEKYAIRSRGLRIYRFTTTGSKKESSQLQNLSEKIPSLMAASQGIVQPVFEQGGSILIPSDEVIVGFTAETSLEKAETYFAPFQASQGIETVKPFRRNAFILQINNPSNGRAYAVAQYFAELDAIRYAEPNHIVLRNDAAPRFNKPDAFQQINKMNILTKKAPPAKVSAVFSADVADTAAAPAWTTLASVDFEGSFPPADWDVGIGTGATNAYWGQTNHRAHNGSSSAYCAVAGTAGVAAPGPAPVNMHAVLRSPVYDLSGYEEVYVEAWFYAVNEVNEVNGGTLYDSPLLLVCDTSAGNCSGSYLAVSYTSDCTQDPTTDNGWRKVLYRVPPAMRVSSAIFDFRFISDDGVQTEGAYIDDIRIVGTTDVDTQPLGNDTFGGRQYELRNMGQVAGLGTDDNDLHVPEAWSVGSVSSSVVVAVIDNGVDLTHPDLNLVEGYDYNGTVGGGPKDAGENHGTACAGNVGAIYNNSLGVIGTAPGIKIMPIYGGATEADLASSIDVAVQHDAKVLSNSWGWVSAPSTAIEDAIDAALAADRAVIFAAGNGPDRTPWTYKVAFPGSLTGSKDIITVGASSLTDEYKGAASSDGQFGWGSSYVGDGPDVVAPGPWSYTTDRQGSDGYNNGSELSDADYDPTFGGTSSSTPKVAGIAALMLSVNPNLTPTQIKSILRETADDIDEPGEDDKTGAGRVNAYKAVIKSKQMAGSGSLIPVIKMLLFDGKEN
jgi:subtilisin family serine protease